MFVLNIIDCFTNETRSESWKKVGSSLSLQSFIYMFESFLQQTTVVQRLYFHLINNYHHSIFNYPLDSAIHPLNNRGPSVVACSNDMSDQ